MKLKFIISLAFITFSTASYAQLIISEVYYDTPYNEKLSFGDNTHGFVDANKHHRGEFIELYNFTDKDVSLKDWYLSDNQGVYWFPADKIIKKGDFIVVAYSTLPYNTTPFTELFSTTVGKESQILLQDQIILRNKRERIVLGNTLNHLTPLMEKSSYSWDFRSDPAPNFIKDIMQNPAQFYDIKSIQYHPSPSSQFYMATPTPLGALLLPPTQSYDEVVKEELQKYYSLLDWTENVNNILDMICAVNIEKVSQQPGGSYFDNGVCFAYDEAGSVISGSNCASSFAPPKESTSKSAVDELEAIKNSILISPNPTKSSDSYNVTISWSGPAMDKINNIQVFNSVGGSVYSFAPGRGVSTTTFNLRDQLPGAFVANFVLTTGQVISKNILKW